MDDFNRALSSFLEPFSSDPPLYTSEPGLAEKVLSTFARVNDFAVTGAELLQAEVLKKHGLFLKSMIESTDRIRKKAQTLFFDPSEPRRIKSTGTPWLVTIKGPFALEFTLADRPVSDPGIQERLEKAVHALSRMLGRAEPEKILVAAVSPQKKKLLGVQTPLGVEILSFPLSISFLMASFCGPKPRLFVAGPVVKEIEL